MRRINLKILSRFSTVFSIFSPNFYKIFKILLNSWSVFYEFPKFPSTFLKLFQIFFKFSELWYLKFTQIFTDTLKNLLRNLKICLTFSLNFLKFYRNFFQNFDKILLRVLKFSWNFTYFLSSSSDFPKIFIKIFNFDEWCGEFLQFHAAIFQTFSNFPQSFFKIFPSFPRNYFRKEFYYTFAQIFP